MPPKKQPPAEPSKPNKFKFVYIEADLSETNFSELTSTIAQVMRPAATASRQISEPKQQGQLGQGAPADERQAEEDVLDAEFEEAAPEPPTVTRAPRNGTPRPKKSKPPEYLHDLVKDSDDLKKFAVEKKPASKAKQYLTAMYWLKESNATPNVNIDRIYTFYKTAGWSVGFNDWNQTFHNLLHEDLIRKADAKGEYTINPTGEDVVKSLPE